MSLPSTRPPLGVADILRTHGDDYRRPHPLSPQQATVPRRLSRCRTAELGGPVDVCNGCGFQRIAYNSCRDRHCPKCQWQQRAARLETRLGWLLPVAYFHVAFTLPDALKPLLLRNQALLYDLLFRAALQALLRLGAVPRGWWPSWVGRPSCTPGARTCCSTRTCNASSPALVSRRTVNTGGRLARTSSCRCACWAACSASSTWRGCVLCTTAANSGAAAAPQRCRRPAPSDGG